MTVTSLATIRRNHSELIIDCSPLADDFAADVIEGLSKPQKEIPPKYFYDDRGSELFEAICTTPEYYVKRTELALLTQIGPQLAGIVGKGANIIEFGSGSEDKILTLLKALPSPHTCICIDISKAALFGAVVSLQRAVPKIQVVGIYADFSLPLSLDSLPARGDGKRVAFFPGSTIGNMAPEQAMEFLRNSKNILKSGDGFIIGVDLKKDKDTLEQAYNDRRGITASFNMNLLSRMNRELNATLIPQNFHHRAFYNENAGRIEMHLESCNNQSFRICDRSFYMRAGETIHTENSYKYSISEFTELAGQAGFTAKCSWTDPRQYFSIHYLEPAS